MSQVAYEVGIGRATLYKYFPDIESIVLARHEEHVAEHLVRLKVRRDGEGTAAERLLLVLREYAEICFLRGRHGSTELAALLHGGDHASDAMDHHGRAPGRRPLAPAFAATGPRWTPPWLAFS